MLKIANLRVEIYDLFQQNKFFFDNEERYAAYYTSMYLLQDTTESLMNHRNNDFSSEPLTAYIEFWGVMQALIIQQDSIAELYKAVTATEMKKRNPASSWLSLRELRNICAGHPAKKDRPNKTPVSRTFMSRQFGKYSAITYEQWQDDNIKSRPIMEKISHPSVNLGELIDRYADEAVIELTEVLESMKNNGLK
ncbi:MAG: hypothetical protein WCK96_01275 [Methylococcales bacterium]